MVWSLLACGWLSPGPVEPVPADLPSCGTEARPAEAPDTALTLAEAMAAAPTVAGPDPRDHPTVAWVDEEWRSVPSPPRPIKGEWFDRASPAAVVMEAGLLVCRLEGTGDRFRLTLGDLPPLEGAGPSPRWLFAAPVTLVGGERLRLETVGEDRTRKAEGPWREGKIAAYRGPKELAVVCRGIPGADLGDAIAGAEAELDQAMARACAPVAPDPTVLSGMALALSDEVRALAGLVGYADPRLTSRQGLASSLADELLTEARTLTVPVKASAVARGKWSDLLGWAARIRVVRPLSCGPNPEGPTGTVRCALEVEVEHRAGDRPVLLEGGWNVRLGYATDVALVDRAGRAHRARGASFHRGGAHVPGEITRLGPDDTARVEVWFILDEDPGGPEALPLLRLSDGTEVRWLLGT